MAKLYKPSAVAAALAVILFIALNVIFEETLSGTRIDLTEDQLYTISDNTEQLLEDLDRPIELTFYFSESVARDFPQFFSYGRRIRDLLRTYSAIGGDNLRLEVVKPEPFSEAEDRAVAAGLESVPTGSGEKIYMGLVARDLTDREEIIPIFSQERESLLEYDITKLIWNVSRAEKPQLALVSSLPLTPQRPPRGRRMPQRGQDGWAIYDQLQQLFEVNQLQPGFERIPEETDVLLLAHPPKLGEKQLYAVDQYVMAGRPAAVFVDPYSESSASPRAARPGQRGRGGPESSSLEPLLSSWGVERVEGKVVADAGIAQRVNMGEGRGPRAIQDFILWLAARKNNMDSKDPVTANLERINLASAGALRPVEDAAAAFTPLVTSSAQSMLMDVERARGMPEPDALMQDFSPDEKSYTLIGRLTGPATSAYPDGPPKTGAAGDGNGQDGGNGQGGGAGGANGQGQSAQSGDGQGQGGRDASAQAEAGGDGGAASGESASAEHIGQAREDIAVLVGADSDLFEDRFWAQQQNVFGQSTTVPIADNATLLVNALEHLAGADALLGLRGRGVTERPFEVVEELRREAEARYLEREKRLEQELQQTEKRLQELQSQMGEGERIVTSEQQQAIERFRERTLEIREQLRQVQRNLVEDIEALENSLAFINIALVPILLTVLALAVAWGRRRLRSRRWAA